MTVLIVDDQPHVVAGMLSGVDWKAAGVTSVFKAYSAPEARDVIGRQAVDILLCDIEMPEESGLSLLKWIRENDYPVECIFITSHADFAYAKEALQYGGFDYILQPARYAEIQRSIMTASEKIQRGKESKKYSSFGRLLYHQKNRMVHSLFLDWLTGKNRDVPAIIEDLQRLEIDIGMETPILPVRILFRDSGQINPENRAILLESAAGASFPPDQYRFFICAMPKDVFALLLYTDKLPGPGTEAAAQGLLRLETMMRREFHCDMVYRPSAQGAVVPVRLQQAFEALSETAVPSNRQGIRQFRHVEEGVGKREESGRFRFTSLETESPLLLCAQIKNSLDALSLKERENAEIRRGLFADFIQVLSSAARKQGFSIDEIFGEPPMRERLQGPPAGIEEIGQLADHAIRFFENTEELEQHEKRQMDIIVDFIRNNIECDIRRDDIAEAVHLNANYVSRLFKKQMAVPLKEFIILEKMKLAKTLLCATNLPISVISMKVGYQNFSHFSQTYKRVMGVSPTGEREKKNEGTS